MEPVFPSVQVNSVLPAEPIEVRIKSNRICMRGKSASYVHHMEFDLSGTALAGQFRPGQAIGVVPPGIDARDDLKRVAFTRFLPRPSVRMVKAWSCLRHASV